MPLSEVALLYGMANLSKFIDMLLEKVDEQLGKQFEPAYKRPSNLIGTGLALGIPVVTYVSRRMSPSFELALNTLGAFQSTKIVEMIADMIGGGGTTTTAARRFIPARPAGRVIRRPPRPQVQQSQTPVQEQTARIY